MAPHSDADITLADAERASAVRLGRLKFPPAVEARFEADTGARRCRRLSAATAVGLALYTLSLKSDAALLADVLPIALIIKLGIIVPLFLLTLLLLSHTPVPWLRETPLALMAIIIMAAHVYLVVASSSPLAVYAHYSAPIDIVFVNLIVRARFWYAAVGSITAFTIYAGGMTQLESLPHEARVSAIMMLAVVVAGTLFANFRLERDGRRAYLVTLQERLRGDALSRANQELSRISNLDAMTGLANRRGLDRRLEMLWLAAQASRQSIAVLMLDVDHFKRFNDRYGHQAGDACLKVLAETLRAQVRSGAELVARYGGEEFIAVLPGADLVDGIRIAERVRRAIEARALRNETVPAQVVTASIGIAAALAAPGLSPLDIIEAADTALYEAKTRGRNRVWPPMLSSDGVHSAGRRVAGNNPTDVADVA